MVPEFESIREAKDYIAGRIAIEAIRQGSPLTELERKMLYFSETGWTLPDMAEVSAEFDRGCSQDEYERKIGGLVGGIHARHDVGSRHESETWDAAVRKLSQEDHYLLVLVGAARSGGRRSTGPRTGPVPIWMIALGFAAALAALWALVQTM